MCDNEYRVPDVVEYEDRVGEHEHGFRDIETRLFVRDRRNRRLEISDRVVGEVADCATVEFREPVDSCVLDFRHSISNKFKWVDLTVLGFDSCREYFRWLGA